MDLQFEVHDCNRFDKNGTFASVLNTMDEFRPTRQMTITFQDAVKTMSVLARTARQNAMETCNGAAICTKPEVPAKRRASLDDVGLTSISDRLCYRMGI